MFGVDLGADMQALSALAILVVMFIMFLRETYPVEVVAMGGAGVMLVLGILPIPALDGGHIMFILIETVIGRKLPDSFMEKAQVFGMVVILALMVFAFGSDILEIIQERFGGQ